MNIEQRTTIERRFSAVVQVITEYKEALARLKGFSWAEDLVARIRHLNVRTMDCDARVHKLADEVSRNPGSLTERQRVMADYYSREHAGLLAEAKFECDVLEPLLRQVSGKRGIVSVHPSG